MRWAEFSRPWQVEPNARRRLMLGRMHPVPIDFYFDFISPYGWFASRQIEAQAIFQAYWGEGRDLSTAQALAAIELPAGIEPAWLRAGIDGPESGPLLRAAVDGSLKRGVFGSPTVLVDGEMFWGFDRLADVDEWLQRGGW